jgi:iron complex outermembrane receptor protein
VWRSIVALCCALSTAAFVSGQGAADPAAATNLGDLSIEQLMNEPVTSVAKKVTNLFQSPAAIAVVTADDISRMDFTSLPEALRYVPGVDVAQIDGSDWAVSVRGSNSQFAEDTLVLIDGRTIYATSFGGVFWKTQGIDMQDIEQIEVIRGPGSTLWGANAFNGVINVISKNAQETQGLRVTGSEGTEDDPSITVRYGGKLGNTIYYRAYVNYFNRNGLEEANGAEAGDYSHGWNYGFRLDDFVSAENSLMIEGNGYSLHTGESQSTPSFDFAAPQVVDLVNGDRGEDLLAKWVRKTSDQAQWSIQAFYDHYHNSVGLSEEFNDTLDVEFQDRFAIGGNQDVVSGFGYRYVRGFLPPNDEVSWTPELDLVHLYTAFVQDQVTLVPTHLSVIPGVKLEHNDVSGFEFEPGARLLWTPSATQTFWLSATRAIRTPSLVDTAAQFTVATFPTAPGEPPAEVVLAGNRAVQTVEKVYAYEAGYRVQLSPQLSLDAAVFYNVYSDLLDYGPPTEQFVFGPPPPHVLLLSTIEPGGVGTSYGFEPSVQWRVNARWRLAADYSLLRSRNSPDSSDSEDSPRYQVHLRSYLDLPHGLELNGALAYVSGIVDTAASVPEPIHSYVRFDLGIVWHLNRSLEIGIWGHNIGDPRHLEFASQITPLLIEVPEEIVTRVTLRY